MGVIEFFVLCVVVVFLGFLATYAMGALAPAHPLIVDRIVWFVVVLIILVVLVNAMGLMGFDPKIPRLH